MGLKEYREKRRQQKKESKSFKGIVQKRTTAAKRRAYAQEAEKVAEERGQALARRPSFGKRVAQRTKAAYQSTHPARRAPVRRAPVRRTMRRAATQQQETQQQPFSIGDLV